MPSWKKIIISGSDAALNTVTAIAFTGSLFGTGSWAISSSRATTASFALTASRVNTLNQEVLITGSLTVGATSLGSSENTLTLGPRDNGSEGGQLMLQAPGGTYTSASMIDNYQNKFRVLRGTNAGSDAFKMQIDMDTGQVQIPNYNSGTAFTGAPVNSLATDTNGNILTVQGYTGTVTIIGNPPGQQNLDFQNGILVNVF